MNKWVVFYDDDERRDSTTFKPDALPLDGVLWIVEFVEGGKRFVHGMDYYMWTGDSWAGGGRADLERWLRRRDRIPIILYGRWTSDAQYGRIAKQAESCCGD